MLDANVMPNFCVKEFQHFRKSDFEFLKGLILRGMLSESVASSGCKSAKNNSGQPGFENQTAPIPQVAVAYSVHVGEKIAQFQIVGCKK